MCCNGWCNKCSNQRRVSFNINLYIFYSYLYSTLRWKGSVDEVATFLDGGKLPCLLVENKADLLEGDNFEKSPELEEFGSNNGFCGSFRTSAKTGLNINESMEYLIKNIIQRMESMQSKGNEVFTTERKSVALDPEKHNEVAQKRKQKDGCC